MKQKTSYPLGTYVIEMNDNTLVTVKIENQHQARFFHNHLSCLAIKSHCVLFYK